ncbi:M20/M25/M40 family metallo-hydrolase [Flavobacterium sp.]|uniref:M20/M25/M40 family metallo-hydrolase n=1 Tax=Flavobacterium sp. TaxID=239 RepID=UPI00262B2A29|nr:M20/M25/M40 family metallo-hydrolase [Flavobacterium sp.]
MKKSILIFSLLGQLVFAQDKINISKEEVKRIETELADDKMQGREIFTPGIELASAFIENEFTKIGLSHYQKLNNYRQEFEVKGKSANNVIGILPGKSKPNEFVVFSAHYDHLGLKTSGKDKVYNGANDDASGVTAVIALAQYFAALNQNERTIIFVAFTGEEVGGFGSKHFSKGINADDVVAMFNVEMIGTESKWGKNSAYITGFEKSDFGEILQKNLKGSNFSFNSDPYPDQQLFYRSDNARLAALGVPAHTISTSKMDSEENYHQLSDEVSTLDLDNMTEIIKSIAISSTSIVNGKDTPTRVEKL